MKPGHKRVGSSDTVMVELFTRTIVPPEKAVVAFQNLFAREADVTVLLPMGRTCKSLAKYASDTNIRIK